eukprot:gene3087-3375_t
MSLLSFALVHTEQDLSTLKQDVSEARGTLAWVDLNYGITGKDILCDTFGEVKANEVCAIMGPSGAGKSSLLNVLAGRSSAAPGIVIEGRVTVGGKIINPVSFRKNIAYVMQDDALIPTATPREALLFSATMRLPASYSEEKIHGLVEELLEELGILDGKVFYHGPCKEVIPHFTSLGYPCPHNYNPSDFIMTLSQKLSEEEASSKGLFQSAPLALQDLGHTRSSTRLNMDVEFKAERSLSRQIMALTIREAVGTVRNVGALAARFGMTVFLYLLFGLIFLGVGGKDYSDDSNMTNHFGGITQLLLISMFGSAQPVMLSFPFERPTFMREYATGTYGAPAYFISKLVIEAPLNFVQQIVAYLLGYFMLDLQGSFIYIVLAAWALGMCSCSVAVMCGCLVSDVKQVTELAPLLFVPQMLFVGFFISTSKIPVFLRWAQYLCSLKYSMNLVLITEFDLDSDKCSASEEARNNCRDLLVNNDVETGRYYVYILILFALFAGFRLAGAFFLVQRAKRLY